MHKLVFSSLRRRLFAVFGSLVLLTASTTAFMVYYYPQLYLLPIACNLITAATMAHYLSRHCTAKLRQIDNTLETASSTHAATALKDSAEMSSSIVRMRHLYGSLSNEPEYMLSSSITSLVNALEAKDSYTSGHSAEVAAITVQVGREMGMSESEISQLHIASILHDIGKIGVPDQILNKPDKLTSSEYELIKQHPVIGAKIIAGMPSPQVVAEIIRHHHARWDGAGYPEKLSGVSIPLGSRIIAVADSYQAIISNRPYRQGRSHQEALAEICRAAGSQFDPAVVEAFLKIYSRQHT